MTHKFSSTDPYLFVKLQALNVQRDDVEDAVSSLNRGTSLLRFFALPSFTNPAGDHIVIETGPAV